MKKRGGVGETSRTKASNDVGQIEGEIRRNINYVIKKPGAESGASQDSTCPVT